MPAAKILLFLLLLCLADVTVKAQNPYRVAGKVLDADTREPLAFVNILVTGTRTGISTDIDGKFSISSPSPIQAIQLSYVGYIPITYSLEGKKTGDLVITLQKRIVDLKEVVILPTVNPAHRIIDSVLANRYRNDPEKLQSFSYTSYEKTIFTAKLDTIIATRQDSLGIPGYDTLIVADTALNGPNQAMIQDTTISDSSMARLKDFFGKQTSLTVS